MQAAISISRLSVHYGPTIALDAVDLEVGSGQTHAHGLKVAGKNNFVICRLKFSGVRKSFFGTPSYGEETTRKRKGIGGRHALNSRDGPQTLLKLADENSALLR